MANDETRTYPIPAWMKLTPPTREQLAQWALEDAYDYHEDEPEEPPWV